MFIYSEYLPPLKVGQIFNNERKIMKYCNKCKRIYNDEDLVCENCKNKSKLLPIKDDNTPVNLLTAEGFELKRVQSALEDAGIPNDAELCEHNYSVSAVTGYDQSKYNVLVPYSAYEQAYDICAGIGAIKLDDEQIVDNEENITDNKAISNEEEFEQMGSTKRTIVRIVTALLFIGLVALAVFGTDFIMNLIKGLF